MSNQGWGNPPGTPPPGQAGGAFDAQQQGAWESTPQQQGGAPQQQQGGAPQQQGAWGAQPHQQGGAFGAPQQQGAWGAQPHQQGGAFGAPQQQGAWAQPQEGAWGAQPQQQGAFGAQPQQGAWGAPQQQGAFGAQPQQGAWGAPHQQGGAFGAPQQQGAWGSQPQQGGAFGAQPQGGAFGAPSQGGAFGAPQGGGAFPQQQQGAAWGGAGSALGGVGAGMLGRFLPRLIGGAVVMVIGLGFAGYNWWRSNQLADPTSEVTVDHVRDHVVSTFTDRMVELPRASQLCGYLVSSASNVRVSDVVTQGNAFGGTGTAVVTLDAQPQAGVTPPIGGPCSASFHYDYRIQTRYEGRTSIDETTLSELQQFHPIGTAATVNGTLQPGDTPFDDGGVFDDWGVRLMANQPITIVARGGAESTNPGGNLDVMIGVFDIRGTSLAQDDDSAGNLNARVVFTPPADGLYLIRVTHALQGTHHGAYVLVTAPGANPSAI